MTGKARKIKSTNRVKISSPSIVFNRQMAKPLVNTKRKRYKGPAV